MKQTDWEEALSNYITRTERPDDALLERTRLAMNRRTARLLASVTAVGLALTALVSLGVFLAVWTSGTGLLGSFFFTSLWLALSQGVMALVWVCRKDVGRIGLDIDRLVQGL